MSRIDMKIKDMEQYQGTNLRPADFDEYWDKGIAEMKKVAPQVTMEKASFQAPNVECYDMHFTGVNGARIYVKHLRPKHIAGKIPAVIMFHGNCHFGKISNLKGACYDDMVAVNAHEGSRGSISNIDIDGLFAERCHSAVRLLTVNDDVENIHISNVYGTYYQYCIGFTKYYPGETTGTFREICLEHIYASKASRDGIYPWEDSFVFPFIFVQDDIHAKNVKITDLFRKEYCNPIETIHIGNNAEIDSLILDNIFTENHTDEEMSLIVNRGNVKGLVRSNINEE